MPRINRIRIVNFSYNNETRHIRDERFDFYGGHDALLHLANGGGKSVLVQLFLQPIVPGAKIQGRNLAGFFRKQKQPAYIMIEWKLDGAGGGYLLTGIGISTADASEQEGKTRIRYFAFTSKYNGANAFDIIDIPLIERQGELIELKSFREARKIMADKAKRDPYLVGYFPEDEGEQYKRHLAEFGISQDEWRNIIAKINDNEKGLDDLFQKYKSSSQLLDDWIINTVEKVMFKGRTEQHQLEEMLQSLVQEVIENERFIMEKQLFTDFLQRLQEVLAGLSGLLNKLDEQNMLGKNLAALHRYLRGEINALHDKHQANEMSREAAQAEEKQVDLEERSQHYHSKNAEYQEAEEKYAAATQVSVAVEGELSEARKREKAILAAGYAAEIKQVSAKLSGIEEKLAMARTDYDKDNRASHLEHTLKIRYEEQLTTLSAELDDLHNNQQEQQQELAEGKELQRRLDADNRRLVEEGGRLQERLNNFIDQEQQLQKQLGINWIRNLLGELNSAEMDVIKQNLQKSLDQILAEYEKLQSEKNALLKKLQDLDGQWKETQKTLEANNIVLNHDRHILKEYQTRSAEVKTILDEHGIDFALVFQPERLEALFARQHKEMSRNAEEAYQTKKETSESLLSIKDGYLHSSPELASVLAELDIQYLTGENYLRNQHPDIRQTLLDRNPILPYAFIMSKTDMDHLAQANVGAVLRRIIPLMSYEDLNIIMDKQGRIARPREEIALACLYEGRVFDQEGLPALIAELEAQQARAAERHEHFSQIYERSQRALADCQRFNYPADFEYQLEKTINENEKNILALNKQLAALEEAKQQTSAQQDEIDRQMRKIFGKITPAEKACEAYQEFLDKEPARQICRDSLEQVRQALKTLTEQKEVLDENLEKFNAALIAVQNQISHREKQTEEIKLKYQFYKDAASGDLVEGSIEELEQRLTAIKEEYNQEISALEKQHKELLEQRQKTQKKLHKIELTEEDYSAIIFDEADLEAAQSKITGLESELKNKQAEKEQASRAEAAAAAALASALDEIKRLGAEVPLPAREIKGDFAVRRKQLQLQITELEEANKAISKELFRYNRTRENIEQTIDLGIIEAAETFIPETDINTQADRWKNEFLDLQNVNLDTASKLRSRYDNCKIDFKDKNLNIDNIFKGLDPLWEKVQMEYDDFYYLYERMSLHGDKLAELILIYENQLANLERNKKDMVQQSFMQGRRLYEEILLISDYSKVRLSGRARPVQMLRIDMQLDNHESAQQRIKDYVEKCIWDVQEKTRQEKPYDELRKYVARLMSSRQLLNEYLGNAHIPVYVFKIDMNMQNSRSKSWEDAVRENSGAERFVVFFSMLSALMTYTRARNMESLGADPDTDTRVMIMDNPFGPISSEHLLEPMFEIAKKHRTQLICLTHLKDNSIMKCFNLIYMMKVRQGAIGSNEYLKSEPIVRDPSILIHDEKLEKAVYRGSEYKEISLFEGD